MIDVTVSVFLLVYFIKQIDSVLLKISQTFLATEKRALDPAEIEEFYSTISA